MADEPAIVVLEPTGAISARTWIDLERQATERLAAGARRFVVDLAGTDTINSVGLRLLVMLSQRLRADGGALLLCGLNDQVRSVVDIAGLSTQFQVVAARAEAMALLEKQPLPPAAPKRSKLARLTGRLLEGTSNKRPADTPPTQPPPAGLTARVAELLGGKNEGLEA